MVVGVDDAVGHLHFDLVRVDYLPDELGVDDADDLLVLLSVEEVVEVLARHREELDLLDFERLAVGVLLEQLGLVRAGYPQLIGLLLADDLVDEAREAAVGVAGRASEHLEHFPRVVSLALVDLFFLLVPLREAPVVAADDRRSVRKRAIGEASVGGGVFDEDLNLLRTLRTGLGVGSLELFGLSADSVQRGRACSGSQDDVFFGELVVGESGVAVVHLVFLERSDDFPHVVEEVWLRYATLRRRAAG